MQNFRKTSLDLLPNLFLNWVFIYYKETREWR